MKIRLTLLTENDKERAPELTEEKVKAAWQIVVDAMCLFSENNDRCVVEKVEFVDSENEEMQEVANRDAFYGESLND